MRYIPALNQEIWYWYIWEDERKSGGGESECESRHTFVRIHLFELQVTIACDHVTHLSDEILFPCNTVAYRSACHFPDRTRTELGNFQPSWGRSHRTDRALLCRRGVVHPQSLQVK